MKIRPQNIFPFFLLFLGWASAESEAQTLLLRQAGTNSNRTTAQIGDMLRIEVVADLQSVSASGIALSLTIPDGPFQVKDNGFPGQIGIQPFTEGPLFEGAGVNANALLTESDEAGGLFPGLQLDFAQGVGVGANRGRSGSGVVATFDLLCVKYRSTTIQYAKPFWSCPTV